MEHRNVGNLDCLSASCQVDLKNWAIEINRKKGQFSKEVRRFLYYQHAHMSSVLYRPALFKLLSPSSSSPMSSRIGKLIEYLDAPAFIITVSMERHQWLGPYKHPFEFAIHAFLQAKEFCNRFRVQIPIVEVTFKKIFGKSEGLQLHMEAMTSLLNEYDLSEYNKDRDIFTIEQS